MLPKKRDAALWLRYGLMALAIFVPLAIPVTASASANLAIRYPGTRGRTYVNTATAFSWMLSPSDYALKFKLRQSSASRINADELAAGLAIGCHDCRAVAIAIQVVAVSKRKLAAVKENTRSYAISHDCVRCSVLADAYEIVFATDSQRLVTDQQKLGLDQVNTDLQDLRNSELRIDQIQSQVADLVNRIVCILRDPSYVARVGAAPNDRASIRSPAGDGPRWERADNDQPVIDVYHQMQRS